jgi:uncharacterized membrane protein required for colicin V production
MAWIDIIIALILIFSFVGGIKSGAIYALFSLLILIIAITIAGFLYGFVASLLSFLPSENWKNFFGFLLTIVVVSIVISVICVIPRNFITSVWNGGGFFSLIGGFFNLANSAIGLVVLMLLFQAYPIMPWLNRILVESTILTELTAYLSFIQLLLPEAFRGIRTAYQLVSAGQGTLS